jgi:hypothetical protein
MAVWSAIESKRRCWFMQELETTHVEWKSYKEILQELIAGTDHIEVLVRASYESLEVYASTMRPVLTDSLLDDNGKEVFNIRRQQQLIKKRQTKTKELEIDLVEDKSPFTSLLASFGVMKNHLDEHIPAIKDGADEMTILKKEVRWKAALVATKMKEVGLAISEELEASEAAIQAAWGKLVMTIVVICFLVNTGTLTS